MLQRSANWLVVALLVFCSSSAWASPRGKAIYQSQCAGCHGPNGQGTDAYERPLVGDQPLSRLAEVIGKTMPEGEPESCSGADAKAVAAYIYDAFYSPIAQARLRPPRVELSRLTARQYEQTLIDLVQSFGWRGKQDDRRGLAEQIFRGKWGQRKNRVRDRVAPIVEFDLLAADLFDEAYLFNKDESLKKMPIQRANKQAVRMQWEGGLLAPETGLYEFFVRTNAGFTLRVNSHAPLLDSRVQSGDEEGGSAKLRLIEGRIYPIKLEVTRIYEKNVTVRLDWRSPSGAVEPVPTHVLTPHKQPPLIVLDAQFPPDDQSTGFVRGASVSARWDEAATHAALEAADWLVGYLPKGIKLSKDPAAARAQARSFCLDFAERAFRRPLSEEEQASVVGAYFDTDAPWPAATKAALVRVLKSPQFLYPELGVGGSEVDWRYASRLALAMWDSTPDKPLNLLARKGELRSKEEVQRQAEWMLRDPRAASKLREFFRTWLQIHGAHSLNRDPKAFPEFDQHVATGMRTSLELMLDDIAWSDSSDFRRLFQTDEVYVNPSLAKFLGLEPPAEQRFVRRRFDSDHRSGVITHPFVVASHAYYRESSPIHRGVFLARHILGRALRPPPVAVAPTAPDLKPGLTTRQRVALQTSPNECQHCHVLINDLGFSLEQFDAVGRFRPDENGKPIDSSGRYTTTDGRSVQFSDARQLAGYLADSRDVQRAFVVRLFEHMAKQPVMAYGHKTPDRLVDYFVQNQFNIQKLMVEIAVMVTLESDERMAVNVKQ